MFAEACCPSLAIPRRINTKMGETSGNLNAVYDLYPLYDADFQQVNLPPRVFFGIGMEGEVIGKWMAVGPRCIFCG